jgi:transcriptional regulator with XRE-family HTH domain
METHNKAFGEALRKLRKTSSRTQEALAFDAKLDRTYISLLELGQRSPTLDTIMALCKALKITLVEFSQEIERNIDQHNG